MSQRGWRDRDHTRGSLFASLLVLALPLLASSVLGGVVFQLVDLTFLSRLGEAPMAAVIIVNQTLRQLLMLILMGWSFGSQALIARAVGEGHIDRAEQVAGQLVLLGAGFASLVALAGLLFPELLFSLPGPDPSFYAHGVPYLRLLYLLSFGLVGTQCFVAILVGAGDTTTPFLVILVQTALAIFAEWVLIFGNLGAPALGVRGAALGIASGQIVAMAIGLSVLFRGRARVHLRGRHLVPNPALMREILKLSWPPAIQMGAAVVMTFAYVRLAGMFGESVQAAYAIGLRLGMIAPMVCFPLATAGATLVGQALGSGNARRAWRAIGVALLVHGAVMWSFALGVFLFRSEIMGLLQRRSEGDRGRHRVPALPVRGVRPVGLPLRVHARAARGRRHAGADGDLARVHLPRVDSPRRLPLAGNRPRPPGPLDRLPRHERLRHAGDGAAGRHGTLEPACGTLRRRPRAELMPYRLLAVDLDGTLMDPNGMLTDAARQAVAAAQDAGLRGRALHRAPLPHDAPRAAHARARRAARW